MKLLLLLIVFAATVLVIRADPPILFKTDFHCKEHTGRWCAAMYFYEEDSSSSDDPVLHFRFCTTNATKIINMHTCPLGGDGFFQKYYEIGYKVFHTCSGSGQSCSHHKKLQSVHDWGSEEVTLHTTIHWPEDSYDNDSVDCFFPNAFVDLEKSYSNPPPIDYFTAMDSIKSDEILYWTPERSGSL